MFDCTLATSSEIEATRDAIFSKKSLLFFFEHNF